MAEYYIGLISGTSADGIDAALVALDNQNLKVVQANTTPYSPSLRQRLLDIAHSNYARDPIDELGELEQLVGASFAAAARQLLQTAGIKASKVRAIGSHGQTVRHRPATQQPFTLQIGNPTVIAAQTGIPVVADFRRRDMAEGGQGAPLAPALHAALFHSDQEYRAVLNLGGIANLTLLPAQGEVTGFDTGPASCLLDAWAQRHLSADYDRHGAWAAGGRVVSPLLSDLLAEPYFRQPPPKSTGREQFNLAWMERHLAQHTLPAPRDLQATLAELTASTVAGALKTHAANCARLLVCGGGAQNKDLLARLAWHLPDLAIESTAVHGLDPDFVEAAAFAWLAHQHLQGLPGNLPSVTGARKSVVLGSLHPA